MYFTMNDWNLIISTNVCCVTLWLLSTAVGYFGHYPYVLFKYVLPTWLSALTIIISIVAGLSTWLGLHKFIYEHHIENDH